MANINFNTFLTTTNKTNYQILRNGQVVSRVISEADVSTTLAELEEQEKKLVELGWVKVAQPMVVTITNKRLGTW